MSKFFKPLFNYPPSYFWIKTIIEFFIVFAFIVGGMIVEVYFRIIKTNLAPLDFSVGYSLLVRSFLVAAVFTFGYRFTKWGLLSYIIDKFKGNQTGREAEKITAIELYNDGFLILTSVLIMMPIRPILQHVIPQTGTIYIDDAFVKYDTRQIFIILAVASVPLLLMLFFNRTVSQRWLRIISLVFIISIGIYTNHGPNYLARMYESRAAWASGNYQKEEQKAKLAIVATVDSHEKAVGYYWLGVSANRQGRPQEALRYQKEAITLDPQYAPPYSSLSLAYSVLGKHEDAKINANQCIKLNPNYAWCYYALAVAQYNTGSTTQALQMFEKAHEIDPLSIDLKNTLDNIKLQTKKNNK